MNEKYSVADFSKGMAEQNDGTLRALQPGRKPDGFLVIESD